MIKKLGGWERLVIFIGVLSSVPPVGFMLAGLTVGTGDYEMFGFGFFALLVVWAVVWGLLWIIAGFRNKESN